MGPVHSPAAVTIPLQKHSKQQNATKSNRTHKNHNQTRNTHQKSKEESDRQSSLVTALYQLRYWYGKNQEKREHRDKNHIAIPSCEWSNTALCGNQGSPQPGSPRSHRASHQGITTHKNKTLRVVLVVKLVGHDSCGADRLPVAVRFPAGPRVRLKTVDPPKGNGLGQKNQNKTLRC